MPGIESSAEEQKEQLEVLKKQLDTKVALIKKYRSTLIAGESKDTK